MKFGLTDNQYAFIQKNVAEPLRAHGALVWCYGSRARGTHDPHSDLDLMVETSHDVSALLSQIQETLTESNFPFKVDLVLLNEFSVNYLPGFHRDKKEF